ncbi:MAG: hypothetical protein ABUS79_21470, partial [Pseudomonadota bacterium]
EPFLRSRGQFCSSLKVALPPTPADQYTDEAWNALPQQANPVTSTTTYCLVNGDKVAFDENGYDPFCRRKQDAKVKCLKDGAVVIDLDILQGRKTGVVTTFEPKGSRRVAYRDDKREGEERITENGKVKSLTWYEKGERIWTKELFPSGKVSAYSRKVADGVAEISVHEDGKVFRLRCSPTLKDDQDLRRWCGFDGAVTTPIYDGTGKIARVQTWKDGVLQKEAAGTSDYGSLSDVAFKDGKKHGEERVYARATNDAPDAKGKLAAIVRWDRGAKDGRETVYADDGVKVTKEIIWKAGETKRVTELYLNGNPKLEEAYDTPTKKQVKAFWDTGKVSREGLFLACDDRDRGWRGRAWCEDGVHRSYFESGAPESEVTFRMGKREGTSKTWWATGKAASVEDYVADHCTKAKRWDQDGKVVADDEFEADGSRKLKK